MSSNIENLMDDPIDIYLAEAAIALVKQRRRWELARDFYRPLINAFQRMGLEPRLTDAVDLNFTGDAHKLASVVRVLRTAGFNTSASKPVKGDTTWHAYYEHPGCELKVWIYFTSSVCKRVQVGTELKEVAIYETRCEDISEPAEVVTPELEAPAPELEMLF